jgi:hypothetical protein
MAVTVGRLRPCGLLDWKFVVLSHNTVRGAAGATILNAELLASLGKLEPLEAAPPDRSGALQRKRTMELVDDIVGGAMGLVGGLGMV